LCESATIFFITCRYLFFPFLKTVNLKISFFKTVFFIRQNDPIFLKQILKEDYGLNKPTIFQAGLWGRSFKLFYGLSSLGLERMLHRRNKYSRFYLNFKFGPLQKIVRSVYFLRHKVLGIYCTNRKTKMFNLAFLKILMMFCRKKS
jgi:hypothetical protein